jgi:hypothetical protein
MIFFFVFFTLVWCLQQRTLDLFYRSININLGYPLMCSMAGFLISAVTYFGREVLRNIGIRLSISTVLSLANKSKICASIGMGASNFCRVDGNISIRFFRINIVIDNDRLELSYASVGSGTNNFKFFYLSDRFQVQSLAVKDGFGTCDVRYNCELCVYS